MIIRLNLWPIKNNYLLLFHRNDLLQQAIRISHIEENLLEKSFCLDMNKAKMP